MKKNEIAKVLRDLRKSPKINLNQARLGEKLSLPQSTISRAEHGSETAQRRVECRIKEVMGYNLNLFEKFDGLKVDKLISQKDQNSNEREKTIKVNISNEIQRKEIIPFSIKIEIA